MIIALQHCMDNGSFRIDTVLFGVYIGWKALTYRFPF